MTSWLAPHRRPASWRFAVCYLAMNLFSYILLVACQTDKKHQNTPQSLNSPLWPWSESWAEIKHKRQTTVTAFFAEQNTSYQAFLNTPVGMQGMPAIIVGLLPDVMPERWGPEALLAIAGTERLLGDFPALLHAGPAMDGGLAVAALSCASCHVGSVEIDSKQQWLIGAPNTQFDIGGFRRKLWQTVEDPRFVLDKFLQALAQKPAGWLYGGEGVAQEAAESAALQTAGVEILDRIRTQTHQQYGNVRQLLATYTYQAMPSLLDGGIPGAVDAFGLTIASQLMPQAAQGLTRDEQRQAQIALLPPAPPMVDIMSVWKQSTRERSQWDGSIKAKLIRNLGAELGVIGSAEAVNFEHAVHMTAFVATMPAAVYPFPVNWRQAQRGKKIYESACAGCHGQEAMVPLAVVATDPNRAIGVTAAARAGLIAALRQACRDPEISDCQASDDDILADRAAEPIYVALPHDGLWARAPYLHNGSVPTLYHLLVPETRPKLFKRGGRHYDTAKVGFDWTDAGREINTEWPGFANSGHADREIFFGGIDFGKDTAARQALLEYLKTL